MGGKIRVSAKDQPRLVKDKFPIMKSSRNTCACPDAMPPRQHLLERAAKLRWEITMLLFALILLAGILWVYFLE